MIDLFCGSSEFNKKIPLEKHFSNISDEDIPKDKLHLAAVEEIEKSKDLPIIKSGSIVNDKEKQIGFYRLMLDRGKEVFLYHYFRSGKTFIQSL